jgi:outer membrane receptor protein involved in Fe transport
MNSFANQAKPVINLTISGKVLDVKTKQPIEYVTISLINEPSKRVVNGSITDKKGNFNLDKIQPGEYLLLVQFLGYNEQTKKIRLNNSSVVLEDVFLEKKNNDLGNVTVTTKKQTLDYRLDKLVFNVEKDVTSQGSMAVDALKKIPGVTVDIDGNIELLGNSSVKFLIDGKPSAIFGNSVADALQSIPSSQIQSIEVITSPSAKYDASGTAGIINIILKKSKIEGFNSNLNAALGTRLENVSLTTSYKKGALGFNAFFSGNAQLTASTPNGLNRLTANNSKRLIQEGINDVSRNGFKGGLSIDWNLSKTETISASFGFNHFGTKSIGLINQQSIDYDAAGSEINHINSIRNATNQLRVTDFENSFSYKKKLKRKGEEIELAYNSSFGNNTTYYNQWQYYYATNNPFAGSNSNNPGKENEANIELNYLLPLHIDIELETGLRVTFQNIISNADVFTWNTSSNAYFKDNAQSYSSAYKRRVYAGYASLKLPITNAIELKAGARYEYTVSNANYSTAHNVQIPDYSNLTPSLVISYKLQKQQSVKLAYSYRIERPDFRDLNPFMNLTDPHNIITGNPNLQPEIGHKIELGYNRSFESGANLNITAFYQRNSPDIKPYISYYSTYKIGDSTYNDVTITTRATITAEVRSGVNISGSLPIGKKITIRPNFQLFNRHLYNPNATPAIINAFGTRSNINITYQATKTFLAEIFGNYNVGMRWQGRQADLYSYTLAIRKQLNNNKASIGFIAVNPFNFYMHQTSQQQTELFLSNIYRNIPYQSFGLTFSYKFGKLKVYKVKETENYNYTPPSEGN